MRRLLFAAPGCLALAALRLLAPFLGDDALTREELAGLRQELLLARAPPLGRERVADWLLAHGGTLGRRYVSDRRRHFGAGATEPIRSPAGDAAPGA